MATPKKPMKNKSTKDFSKKNLNKDEPTKKSFDSKEYEQLKDMLSKVNEVKEQIDSCLKSNSEPIKDLDKYDFRTICSLMYECFEALEKTIYDYENSSSYHAPIKSLYVEIYNKLLETIKSYQIVINKKQSILKSKLFDLEQDRKAYIEKELKAMTSNEKDPDWINNSSFSLEQLMTIISAALGGLGIQLPNGKVLVFDQNGCRFR